MIERLKRLFSPQRELSPLFEVGFHGDTYLLNYLDRVMAPVEAFIETGANVGTTLRYVLQRFPHVEAYSCEPDKSAYQRTLQNLGDLVDRPHFYNMLSPDFIYKIHQEFPKLNQSLNFYWLDAHDYGYQWPLADELRYITTHTQRAIILIDDAEVPDHPEFKFCAYDGQTCDVAYMMAALAPGQSYQFVFPDYTEHTSKHHPLVGYNFIFWGDLVPPQSEDFVIKTINT